MKTVILAGGLGSRISEETLLKPKPMVEIAGKPILWHILKIYSHYGFNDFIICTGYKGYIIKEYFANYFLHQSDVTFDMENNKIEIHSNYCEPWKVTIVDTGESTNTGGRVKKIQKYVKNESFCLTYGDGLCNVDITDLIKFHKSQKTFATLTMTQPPGRFGSLLVKDNKVEEFREKPPGEGGWINGGFFVLEPEIFDFIDGDQTSWEYISLPKLSKSGQLSAYKHTGFWMAMDTLRDKSKLEELWNYGNAPWKIWD